MKPISVVGSIVALVALVTGCGDSPTSPSPQRGLVRLEITGPEAVEPGQTLQLGARGVLSDGSTIDVTRQVRWEVAPNKPFEISAAGLVTAGQRLGEAQVIASYVGSPAAEADAARAVRDLFVLPAGTYRFAGLIRNEGVPLNGAVIILKSGGRVEATGTSSGSFAFYGFSGEVEMQIESDGYLPDVRRTSVSSHRAETFDVGLTPNVAGTYALSISAAADCRGNLPEAARDRRYTVTISQHGVDLDLAFAGLQRFLKGTARSGGATFTLPSNPLTPPVLFEDFAATEDAYTSIAIFGSAAVTRVATGFSGQLDGAMELWTITDWWDGPWIRGGAGSCQSAGHRFALSRTGGYR